MSGELFETTAATIRVRDDGILHVVARPGTRFDGPLTEELFATYESVGTGGPFLVLNDIRGVASSSPESRDLASSDRSTALHTALALVVDSRISRMMGNLFLTLSRPKFPTRLFSDEDAATRWLLAHGTEG